MLSKRSIRFSVLWEWCNATGLFECTFQMGEISPGRFITIYQYSRFSPKQWSTHRSHNRVDFWAPRAFEEKTGWTLPPDQSSTRILRLCCAKQMWWSLSNTTFRLKSLTLYQIASSPRKVMQFGAKKCCAEVFCFLMRDFPYDGMRQAIWDGGSRNGHSCQTVNRVIFVFQQFTTQTWIDNLVYHESYGFDNAIKNYDLVVNLFSHELDPGFNVNQFLWLNELHLCQDFLFP